MKLSIKAHPTMPDALWNQIPDEHALRVGRFMAAWSLIEFKLECLIWHLIGADQHDLRPLTARLDARPKREAIIELLRRREISRDQREAWDRANAIISELTKPRGWLAHGIWVPYPLLRTGVLLTRKGRAPDTIARLRPISVADLDGWLNNAAEAVRHLNALLPDKPDERAASITR